MKRLVTYCNNCSSKIRLKKSANDRVALQMKIGSNTSLTCSKCQMTHNYHINKIVATHTFIPLITMILGIIIIPILISYLKANHFLQLDQIFYNGGLIPITIIIPFLFYFTINANENTEIRSFNRHKVKEE